MADIIDVSLKRPLPQKVHLGDGAYATFDGFHIVLTAEDSITITNTVYLEDWVYRALVEYARQIGWEAPA